MTDRTLNALLDFVTVLALGYTIGMLVATWIDRKHEQGGKK